MALALHVLNALLKKWLLKLETTVVRDYAFIVANIPSIVHFDLIQTNVWKWVLGWRTSFSSRMGLWVWPWNESEEQYLKERCCSK